MQSDIRGLVREGGHKDWGRETRGREGEGSYELIGNAVYDG